MAPILLLDFPLELIEGIVSAEYTDPSEYNGRPSDTLAYRRRVLLIRDLNSLTRVCRALYNIVNPMLYMFNRDFQGFSLLPKVIGKDNTHTLEAVKRLQLDLHYFDRIRNNCLLDVSFGLNSPNSFEWLIENGVGSFETWYETTVVREPFGVVATRSKLRKAIESKFEGIATVLLKRGATLFFMTRRDGSAYLDERDSNVRVEDLKLTTALHLAASNDMPGVVKHLVENVKLPVDLRNSDDATPLYSVIRSFERFMEENRNRPVRTVKQLIDYGADVNVSVCGRHPLATSIFMGNFAHADILLNAGAKVKADDGASYPVHTCASVWLDDPLRRPYQLWMLCRLVDAGGDLEERNERGHTPLQQAILRIGFDKKLTVIRQLLAMGASTKGLLDFLVKEHEDVSIRRIAAILVEIGIRIDQPLTSKPHTFIEWVALRKSRHLVDYLITIATPATLHQDHLNDVLAKCITRRRFPICDILIRHGAVLKDTELAFTTAWDLIEKSLGQYEMGSKERWLNMILNMGIPQEKVTCLLTQALELQDEISANHLLCRLGTSIPNPNPEWLHLASKWGVIYIMQNVLKVTKDVNVLSKESKTPLAESLTPGAKGTIIARLLLHNGVNPFSPTKSPLFPKETDWKIVKNSPGVSAFEIAIRNDKFLPIVKEMWLKSPPDTRPELDDFIACVPSECPKIARWLEKTKNSTDHEARPTDFLTRDAVKYNLDNKQDWEDKFCRVEGTYWRVGLPEYYSDSGDFVTESSSEGSSSDDDDLVVDTTN
ncbi:ankyrin repeat-containing domain protein [Hypoxylon rubiginosum]|uniref:Ankyrin repeat-containing domain protein n=1 Tax=Hypoxylon rubiginosum TaxID=110542 RepID=A0ACC0D4E3_9PEZI|nr:ankyrin repeat-containing domain protein [Hypoxylon rubiginosum]